MESLITECISIFKREDVKTEIKSIIQPFVHELLEEIYPYLYLSILFVVISFLLILAIFFLLMRYKNTNKLI